ncbi:hypothetical protein BY996DRAFT_6415492 [Phakopsora pachyrhizi]|nr:hypothetical protein BY996DRAFT_6415492 [Phakopsora pachyrhizi]
MELSEDKPLCSSDAECHSPKKSHKNDATNPFSNSTLLGSGRSGNFHGVIYAPNDIHHTIYKPSSNAHYFTNLIRQNSQGLGNVAEHIQSPKPRIFCEKTHTTHVSSNQTSSTLSTTEPSENLGNNPLELLLVSLEACLEIAPGQDLFVHKIARLITSDTQHAAIVYMLFQMSHKLDLLGESLMNVQHINNTEIDIKGSLGTYGGQNFLWTKPPKFFISPEVESYTKGTDSGSVVIGKSLFAMTMFFKKKLSEKPKEWKQKFLPYTFGNKDNEARLLVATEVRQILKQERNVFKHKIFEWAAPKGTSYSNKEIKEKFQDVSVQQRFALLCLCAIYKHFHNHEAPWPEVDDQLEKLKKHTSRFRHA